MAFETLFRVDVSVGYWLYQNPNSRLNSIAAMFDVTTRTRWETLYRHVVNLGPQLVVNVGKTEVSTGLLVPVSNDQATSRNSRST